MPILRITSKDIKTGKRCSLISCPVAKSGRRHFRVRSVDVTGYELYVGRAHADWYRLPKSARRWISRFDRGLPVKPFSFRLGRRYTPTGRAVNV